MSVDEAPPLATGAGARPAEPRSAARACDGLSRGDRLVVGLMVGIPLVLVVGLVWLPAIATVVLSFTSWNGIGGLDTIQWVGTKNYIDVFTIYPPFQPAIEHNLLWLAVLFLIATPLGMFLAVLLDKELRGSRFYQTALYLPVVLSLALVGFIWQLIYSQDQGLLNAVLGHPRRLVRRPERQHLGGARRRQLAARRLHHAAVPGRAEGRRPVAAGGRGGRRRQRDADVFFRVVFPVMRPINIIVLVITVIEALRAFDLVWVVNKGRNGLELISALVTQNVVGEASRIGFGSALATIMLVISLVFIALYLATVMREDKSMTATTATAAPASTEPCGERAVGRSACGRGGPARVPDRHRAGLALPGRSGRC